MLNVEMLLDKDYEFVMQCGTWTPSYDRDTLDFASNCPHYRHFFEKNCQTVEQVNEIVNTYLESKGRVLTQKTPVFSAIKVNGVRLYEHAYERLAEMREEDEQSRSFRTMYSEEEELGIPMRNIRIDRLECTGINHETGQISFSTSCSKGTYIRILGYEISHVLEVCGSYITDLKRTRIGDFTQMLQLDEIGNKE